MNLSIIAAVSSNGVIGKQSGLPWKMGSDLRRFKELTMGKILVVGHPTAATLPTLPKRAVVIYSRKEEGAKVYVTGNATKVFVTNNIPEVVPLVKSVLPWIDDSEIMIGGGAGIFKEFEPQANRMYLTEVLGNVEGDTYFPDIDMSKWNEVQYLEIDKQEKDDFASVFRVYERFLIQS